MFSSAQSGCRHVVHVHKGTPNGEQQRQSKHLNVKTLIISKYLCCWSLIYKLVNFTFIYRFFFRVCAPESRALSPSSTLKTGCHPCHRRFRFCFTRPYSTLPELTASDEEHEEWCVRDHCIWSCPTVSHAFGFAPFSGDSIVERNRLLACIQPPNPYYNIFKMIANTFSVTQFGANNTLEYFGLIFVFFSFFAFFISPHYYYYLYEVFQFVREPTAAKCPRKGGADTRVLHIRGRSAKTKRRRHKKSE